MNLFVGEGSLLSVLDELGFEGWVGCEYRPKLGTQAGGTSAGLGWLKRQALG
jgi:hydroxypyruvate isomerase